MWVAGARRKRTADKTSGYPSLTAEVLSSLPLSRGSQACAAKGQLLNAICMTSYSTTRATGWYLTVVVCWKRVKAEVLKSKDFTQLRLYTYPGVPRRRIGLQATLL